MAPYNTSVSVFRLAGLAIALFRVGTLACSRVMYDSGAADGHRIVIGRTMDWLTATNSSLYVFPAGLCRTGHAGSNSLSWHSKYGSVVTTMYNVAVVDGMNSEGLVGSVLYLADSDYGAHDISRPALSIGLWLQYFLDQYSTVAEAANDLFHPTGAEKFQVVTKTLVPGVPSLGHIALSDKSGDNLIMEYLNGTLQVHHSKAYVVMTNEPSFDQQLAINTYWQPISNMSLPGTDRPADRFVRLSYYVNGAPSSNDMVSAVATTAGMVRAVSVPLKPTSIETPNISPTLWRIYADTKDLRYFYESATEPSFLWVDLDELDLSSTGQVLGLTLSNVSWEERIGDMSKEFVKLDAFHPLDIPDHIHTFQQASDSSIYQEHLAPIINKLYQIV